ncbi:pitrilysin family protein [Candidatus Methylomirabilis sp.]|uniref:M16 family metallopeptidase n=1 Tax=Candidatus Methylomirabilis sp. TaxID=2032687 RepID=UPI002A5BAAE5|nr:pitrilysin family protein [Candidatus Methylomirabilis sp.]
MISARRGYRWGLSFSLILLLLQPMLVAAAPLAERQVLENGLTLLVRSSRALPIVTIRVTVQAGSLWEQKGRAGLANLTALLLTRGTATRTAAQLDESVDFIGASLSSSADRDLSELDLTVLKKDLPKGLELLTDVLRHPAFEQGEIARKVQELKAALRKRQEDPGEVAHEAFNDLVFGSHPYGRPLEGTDTTLATITRDEIVRFHRDHYTPERTFVTVVGDIDRSEITNQIRALLGSWPKGNGTVARATEPTPLQEKIVVKRIDRNVAQANIVLGHQGIRRDNPDFYALTVMNYILGGGGFSSRLVERIREQKGWAYDVSSQFSPGLERGSFRVVLQTKNETAGPAVQEVVRELRRIREQGVTDQELADAKAYLTGSFPLRLDTNAKLAGLISSVEYYKLGLDYADRYRSLIDGVSKEDILRVARTYLNPEGYVLVVVADQAKAALSE